MANNSSQMPILITHWDPDLYPARPAPCIQELVVHVLTSKTLLIKEVDLLLNEKLRKEFREPPIVRQFASLLNTGRIRVLFPPLSTDFGNIDPHIRPMTAVAQERERKRRPLKSKFRKLTRNDQRFCDELDKILVGAGVVEFRKDFPSENDFAKTLSAVLSNKDRGWRRRPHFRGIDEQMAETFVRYCHEPELAISELARHHVVPNAREFYRSLGYQVADLYPPKERRAMKNLLQSVYAHCELYRQGALGTYFGTRIAELPPTAGDTSNDDLLKMETVMPLKDPVVNVPIAENIGDVVARVLEECGPTLSPLTNIAPGRATISDKWEQLADSFARHSVRCKPVTWSSNAQQLWHVSHQIRLGLFLLEAAGIVGVRFVSTFAHLPPVEYTLAATHGLTYCARPIVEWIRRGKAYDDRDTERARIQRVLLDAISVRVSHLD